MTQSDLTALNKKYLRLMREADAGQVKAQKELFQAASSYSRLVNKEMRFMERKGFDYGAAYNNIQFYLQTMDLGKRLPTGPKLQDMGTVQAFHQLRMSLKFLSLKSGSVAGQETILRNRIETFKNQGIIPANYSLRSSKSFIKFLANEETTAVIEEYGTSDIVLKMISDAFFSRKNTQAQMKLAFMEFTSGRKNFDEMMRGLGVDVYNKKYRRQQAQKNSLFD